MLSTKINWRLLRGPPPDPLEERRRQNLRYHAALEHMAMPEQVEPAAPAPQGEEGVGAVEERVGAVEERVGDQAAPIPQREGVGAAQDPNEAAGNMAAQSADNIDQSKCDCCPCTIM